MSEKLVFFFLFFVYFSNALLFVRQKQKCLQKDDSIQTSAAFIRGQTSVGLPAVCYQRSDPGPCGQDVIRVFYDFRTHRCKHFSYSGCGGNANRFVSIKNCYHVCAPGLRTKIILKTIPKTKDSKDCLSAALPLPPAHLKTENSGIQIE